MSGSLRVLEPAVSCRVHSAYSLESFAQCVLELVENGVDAGASSLVVKVNAAVWKVKVVKQLHQPATSCVQKMCRWRWFFSTGVRQWTRHPPRRVAVAGGGALRQQQTSAGEKPAVRFPW